VLPVRSSTLMRSCAALALAAALGACVSVDMEPLETAGQALENTWTDERIREAASDAPPVFVPEERLTRAERRAMDQAASVVGARGQASRAALLALELDPLENPAAYAAQARARALPPPPPPD